MELSAEIRNYIKANNGSCEVYPAPFDVILKNNDEIIEDKVRVGIYNNLEIDFNSFDL